MTEDFKRIKDNLERLRNIYLNKFKTGEDRQMHVVKEDEINRIKLIKRLKFKPVDEFETSLDLNPYLLLIGGIIIDMRYDKKLVILIVNMIDPIVKYLRDNIKKEIENGRSQSQKYPGFVTFTEMARMYIECEEMITQHLMSEIVSLKNTKGAIITKYSLK